MSRSANLRFAEVFAELERMLRTPPHVFSSSLDDFYASPEYQTLISLGSAILPACVVKIREGAWFLTHAAMNLLGLSPGDLVPENEFPSEQELAEGLVRYWEDAMLTVAWTAETEPCRVDHVEAESGGQTSTQEQHPAEAVPPDWAA